MIERRLVRKESLDPLLAKIIAGGRRILAPHRHGNTLVFDEISQLAEIAAGAIQTDLSAKAAIFPRCEELFRFRNEGDAVTMEENPSVPPPTVIFGLRPCDARSIATLNAIFAADHPDALFQRRLDSVAVIGLSCPEADEYCFCTSTGGHPGDTAGSDILLTRIDGENFLAEIVTEKGQGIVALAPDIFLPPPPVSKEDFLARLPAEIDAAALPGKLTSLFYNEGFWLEQSLRCLGCGACAFVCPACACFDMQDEAGREGGKRLRCWDSCGFSLFTLHTSGHNPRDNQSARWRQRVMHKFVYLPDRNGIPGCVGCGRCSRACPADMNMREHLRSVMEEKS